jgi:hypothetical protein
MRRRGDDGPVRDAGATRPVTIAASARPRRGASVAHAATAPRSTRNRPASNSGWATIWRAATGICTGLRPRTPAARRGPCWRSSDRGHASSTSRSRHPGPVTGERQQAAGTKALQQRCGPSPRSPAAGADPAAWRVRPASYVQSRAPLSPAIGRARVRAAAGPTDTRPPPRRVPPVAEAPLAAVSPAPCRAWPGQPPGVVGRTPAASVACGHAVAAPGTGPVLRGSYHAD